MNAVKRGAVQMNSVLSRVHSGWICPAPIPLSSRRRTRHCKLYTLLWLLILSTLSRASVSSNKQSLIVATLLIRQHPSSTTFNVSFCCGIQRTRSISCVLKCSVACRTFRAVRRCFSEQPAVGCTALSEFQRWQIVSPKSNELQIICTGKNCQMCSILNGKIHSEVHI